MIFNDKTKCFAVWEIFGLIKYLKACIISMSPMHLESHEFKPDTKFTLNMHPSVIVLIH